MQPHALLAAEQLDGLLRDSMEQTAIGFRDAQLLALLTTIGLRPGEVCSLRLADVHADHLTVTNPKTSSEREVCLGHDLSIDLRRYIDRYRTPLHGDESVLFLTQQGEPLDRQTLFSIVQAATERAGMRHLHITPHLIRQSVRAALAAQFRASKEQ